MRASLIAWSIPAFFVLIAVELAIARARGRRLARFQDSINSLSCGVGQQVLGVGLTAITIGAYVVIYERWAVTRLDVSAAWVWICGGLGVDLCYYWMHRASHRVGFLWAGHVVHHQSEEYNLTTALRQSTLQGALGAAFYWPLALLGLPPEVFITLSTINTLYQFWIHTRLVGKLGPLEWVLNTPSHHRVHHAIDPEYIDKNYAGILIIWDRLFGTFVEEKREPAYGTVKPLHSWNPLWANLEAWAYMWRLSRASSRLRDRVWAFFAPPEWRPRELGGRVTVPEVDHARRVLYEHAPDPILHAYVALHFVLVALATLRVLVGAEGLELGLLVAWTSVSLIAWGALFERKAWGAPLEIARLMAAPILVCLVHPEWTMPALIAGLIVLMVSLIALSRVDARRSAALTA